MQLNEFIKELAVAAENLGRPLDKDARDLLAQAIINSQAESNSEDSPHGPIKTRARLVVLRAVTAAKNEGLASVNRATLLGLLAG